ncbi:MAG: hypothetical protein ACYSWS_01845 [Planctomycetota bacterium]|jgi:hypothetical protein
MTFDKFKKNFLRFLEESTVNLGRKTAKTRKTFLAEAKQKFDAFAQSNMEDMPEEKAIEKSPRNMSDRVMRIKPTDKRKALDAGKGVHSMTASESQRADEQLGHSPYVGKERQTDE